MKRILSVLLAALFLLAALAACGEAETPADTTAGPDAVTTDGAVTDPPAATEYAPSNVPEDLKFPGKKIKFLYWSDVEREEFFVEEENGEKVHDAIHKKNLVTEGQLGVTLEWIPQVGNFGNQAAFVSAAENSVKGGEDTAYDFYCSYSLAAPTMALRGLSQNMLDYPIIDLSQPWWPSSLVSQATIGGRLYFVSGDLSTNLLYFMYAMFFNKDLYDSYHNGERSLYDTVTSGEWTFDELLRVCEGVYDDFNKNGTADYGDLFGFQSIDLHFDAFYIGSALKNLEVDGDGRIVASDDFDSERATELAERLCQFLFKSGYAFGKGTTSNYSSAQAFAKGEAMIVCDRVYIASGTLKSSDVNYGIIPVPKYNADQEDYVTCMAFPYTMYSMSVASPDKEAAAATLEVMCYTSYVNIKPALFEESMKARYSREANDAKMYDIIYGNVFFELGRIFTTDTKNIPYSVFRDAIKSNQGSFYKRLSGTGKKQLVEYCKTINESLEKIR